MEGRVSILLGCLRASRTIFYGRFYKLFKYRKCSLVVDKRLRSGLKAQQKRIAQGNALGRLAADVAP